MTRLNCDFVEQRKKGQYFEIILKNVHWTKVDGGRQYNFLPSDQSVSSVNLAPLG